MSDPYNLSYLDNATSLVDAARGVSDASGGLLGGLLLLAFAILFLIVFHKEDDLPHVLLADAWLTAILSVLFRITGMVESWVVGLCFALAVIALIIIKINE